MDRANIGKNLEALAEEDDEEEAEEFKDSEEESETDSSEEEESGIQQGEPNKFDSLCDGLLNAMALVHSAMKEVLDMKDEMLSHALPPSLLVHLSMTTSKLFRSVSDLGMPVNELVRLVRVYCTPWEEKSAALKKLHEDYHSKQRQLHIAIKRLQLVDAHSKRIAREKRVMNWEKLFAKLTSSKGHGRRWKFLIATIKQKAQMGLEHVQAYTQALEQSSDSEEDLPTTAAPDTPSHLRSSPGDEENEDDDESEDEESGGSPGKSASRQSDPPTVAILAASPSLDSSVDEQSRSGSSKKVRFESEQVQPIKPPMIDQSVSTETPEYERSLFVRIFCPTGLEDRAEIKCTLTCNGQVYKTDPLDSPEEEEEEQTQQVSRRPRAAAGNTRRTPEESQLPNSEEPPKKSKRFKEFEIPLPAEVVAGCVRVEGCEEDPENMQIAVHHGQYEELLAMATIDFSDIKELPLKTVYLPPPEGDNNVLPAHTRSLSDMGDIDDLSDSIDLDLEEEVNGSHAEEDRAADIAALPFPLYSLQAGVSEALHKPCGTLPLVLYWGKREMPKVFNRQTGTLGVEDLVYDLTGIDLASTTKEELHKETMDRSASAVTFTPEAAEETIPKHELDSLISQHQEELQYLQDEYERRLQEVMMTLQTLQEENQALSQQQQQQHVRRPLSSASGTRPSPTPPSPGPVTFHSPPSAKVGPHAVTMDTALANMASSGDQGRPHSAGGKIKPQPPREPKAQRNFMIGRPLPKWGESLPQNFLERLQLFEEESRARKQELNERTLREIQETIEKKLAGQHKLSKREEQMYDALKDVSLPALFMPVKTGNVFNPRAHQYFHPSGSADLRLTQPPSMFQLPPLPHNSKMSVVNLFELSKNFHSHGPDWLVERYLRQQRPLSADPNQPATPAPTTSLQPSAQRHFPQGQSSARSSLSGRDRQSRQQAVFEQEVEA